MKAFDKHATVAGRSILLRAATPDDAAFVFALRSDPVRARFLSPIQGGVEDQRAWLARCAADPHQIYFVICTLSHDPLGLVRLYDQQGASFCWGSWLIKPDAPPSAALESALLVYRYALDVMGFEASHFDVRRGNDGVIGFHTKFGAVEVARDERDIFFRIDRAAILAALSKFRKYLPDTGH